MLTPERASHCISRWRELLAPGLGNAELEDGVTQSKGLLSA